MTRIRTAIIPAVGLGTRMLTATDAVPKELLPLRGRPALDWLLDEASIAGIEQVVIVATEGQSGIEKYVSLADHTGCQFPSEQQRVLLGLTSEEPSRPLEIHFILQTGMRGLGDAALQAWHAIGNEPVAVLLPHEVMLGGAELLATMLEHHDRQARSVVAIAQVLVEIGANGCVELSNPGTNPTMTVTRCTEKPRAEMASPESARRGRYLLGIEFRRTRSRPPKLRTATTLFITALDTAARANNLLSVEVLPRDGRIEIGDRSGQWRRAADEERLLQVTGQLADSRVSMVA